MSRRAFVLGSAASTIFGLVTAGCQIVPTHVTETPAQIPTETKVPASTVTSTPENTTTPTEAATLNPEQIIDGRISDFLNGRGDFSDAALKDKIFLSSDHKLYPNEQITDDLGVLENDNQAAVAQGIILGSEIQGDNVIVIVGTKNYEGKRIVIPFYNNNVTFKIGGVELLFYNNGSYIGYSHDESMIFNNMEDYNDLLNKNIGNPIGFNLVLDSGFYSKVDEANFDKAVLPQALKNGYTTNDVHNVFTSMVNDIAIEKKIYPELYKCYQKWASVNADESKDITIINSMADIKNGIDPLKTSQLWVASIIGDDGK